MACTSDLPDHILRSRIEDTVRLCNKRGVPCFLGFLDLREQAYTQQCLRYNADSVTISFFGGYPEAERSLLCVSPSYYPVEQNEFPLCAVAFRYRTQKKLTHRDVLGTLMNLGIKRDAVGDILCGEGLSVVFVRDEIAPYICEQVQRIGGEGVTVLPDYDGELPIHTDYEPIRESVASPRADSIVKALVRCSREQAADMIRLGSVSINHMPIDSVSKAINEGDTVSIRGFGRFHIDQIGPLTKKGRLTLLARRRL